MAGGHYLDSAREVLSALPNSFLFGDRITFVAYLGRYEHALEGRENACENEWVGNYTREDDNACDMTNGAI